MEQSLACPDCGSPVTKPGCRCRSCAATRRWTNRQPLRRFVVFEGIRYFLQGDGYWRSSRPAGNRLLHRVVWEHYNGPIPDNFHVHHINGNRSDYCIENLVVLSPSEHADQHPRLSPTEAVRERISEKTKAQWAGRQPVDRVCDECHRPFQSRGTRVRFCGPPCNSRYWNRVRSQRAKDARL